MRFFHMAFAVMIACTTAAAVGAAQYRAWGVVRRPSTPVSRSSFTRAEPVSMAGRAVASNVSATSGCNCDGGGPVAYGGDAYGGDACGPDCGCDDCCGQPCDPWCGSGPCLLPNLVGGIIREVGCGLHWLFCCPMCGGAHYDLRDGGGCGGGCGGGAYYDAGYDSGCTDCDSGGAGTIEANHPDLMPTPTPPVRKQANPFKDDTASVHPRRSYRPTRRPTVRRAAAARQPSVIRSTYAAPLPRAAASNAVPRSRPRVKKAEILQSLKTAIQ